MAIWVRFGKDINLESLSGNVSRKGLYLSDGNFYNTGNTTYNAVRMGFASLNEKEMMEAISIIKKAI
jgi:GntR family transcriptional regulator/MocR family aminotransferase